MLYTRLASPAAVCIAIRGILPRLAWVANSTDPNTNPDPNLSSNANPNPNPTVASSDGSFCCCAQLPHL